MDLEGSQKSENFILYYHFAFVSELLEMKMVLSLLFSTFPLCILTGLTIYAITIRSDSRKVLVASILSVVFWSVMMLPPDFCHDYFGVSLTKKLWIIEVVVYGMLIVTLLTVIKKHRVKSNEVNLSRWIGYSFLLPLIPTIVFASIFGYDFLFFFR